VLEVKDLTVHYDKALALDHVSLNVEGSEIVAVLGANGAGKSTLLRAISGLVRGTGEILFDQARLDTLHRHEIVEAGVVHCPEGRRLFPEMTVLDNLLLGAYLRKERRRIDEDREKVYDLFPILKERSKQVASTLSGGEQQMVALGRSLMSNPRLLMLDEPSLGLAPLAQETIFRGIKEIAKSGMSVLLVEQNARQALTIARRAYVLEVGKVVLSGMSRDLAGDPHVREAYLAP
jgi:branched-chain amino acid transport system ATP-binding protein